jgi:hypothetical protein
MMTAASIARGLRGRRSGAGYVALCPVHEADGRPHNPSLSIRERVGKIWVHCFAGCAQSDVIDALRVRGLWPERERRERTPAERQAWAQQQRDLERDLPAARRWRRAAELMVEDELAAINVNKCYVFCDFTVFSRGAWGSFASL